MEENKSFDLEERTSVFGEEIIKLLKKVSQDTITKPIINQLVRSATSIGANYMEANGASSRKDFRNKIYICQKESRETKYWLRMLANCEVGFKSEIRTLWSECQELTLIFGKITSTINKRNDNKIE
jgi:four helix bundle protein